jgi:hypothetical protein
MKPQGKCAQREGDPLGFAPASVPERLIQAAVKAAIRITCQVDRAEKLVASRTVKHPSFADETLDDLGRRLGQFPSVGVPPAFDEPCEEGTDHVPWYAC